LSGTAIVVGVDVSPQSAAAAEAGALIAQATAMPCWLVHGARLMFDPPGAAEFVTDVERLVKYHAQLARGRLQAALHGHVPDDALAKLDIRLGSPAGVVAEVAHERNAALVVVGGKHHTALARWTGGSTALHLVRATDIPLLVVGQRSESFRRVLAAVDLSYALRPTFETAARFAALFGADLRVLHVVEPLPAVAELPVALSDEAFFAASEEEFQRALRPLIERVAADTAVRRGPAAQTVAAETTAWNADLVVVGSHGKGWMHRLLLGSVTEQLLNALPTSLLVVPVPAPAATPQRGRRLVARVGSAVPTVRAW
jgi:nucleotide-binding universal stress UspA family protein